MRMESWAITDVGKKRDHNEDSHLVNDETGLYVVADGMGGHIAGETASRTAVEVMDEVIREKLSQLTPNDSQQPATGTRMMFSVEDPVETMLADAVRAASGAILDKIEEDRNLAGMGTTVCSLLFHENKLYFAHVGDSRLYRIHDDQIDQVSTDHSLVQEQVDAGLITKEQAETSKYKNIITRSVGFERDILVDSDLVPCKTGDRFLLCSDGLTNYVTEAEILNIATNKDPETTLGFFVNLANSRGGDDNITAILLQAVAD